MKFQLVCLRSLTIVLKSTKGVRANAMLYLNWILNGTMTAKNQDFALKLPSSSAAARILAKLHVTAHDSQNKNCTVCE